MCCNKKVFQAYGYLWSFDENYIPKKKKRKNCKTVYQYDLDGRLVKVWESLVEIEKTLGYSKNNISHCCLGRSVSAYAYIWRYEKKDNIQYINKNLKKQKEIYQMTKTKEIIKIWDSLESIENETGYNRSAISQCCLCKLKTAYGFIWRYDNTLNDNLSLVSAQAKRVMQMDKEYNIIAIFNSMSEAERITGINNISNCCNGKRKTAGGYIWIYEDNYDNFDIDKHRNNCTHVREVEQYDLDMNYIKTFKSVTDAAKEVDGATGNISLCCNGKVKTAYGYIWRYKYN